MGSSIAVESILETVWQQTIDLKCREFKMILEQVHHLHSKNLYEKNEWNRGI